MLLLSYTWECENCNFVKIYFEVMLRENKLSCVNFSFYELILLHRICMKKAISLFIFVMDANLLD